MQVEAHHGAVNYSDINTRKWKEAKNRWKPIESKHVDVVSVRSYD